MGKHRGNGHSVTRISCHIIWVTKYRYKVLEGDIQKRCRKLLMQISDAENIQILSGVVSKDHVHMLIEYPPTKSVSSIVKKYKGHTSRKLQLEYTELKNKYWGKHFWGIGYAAWSTGNVTEEMIKQCAANNITLV